MQQGFQETPRQNNTTTRIHNERGQTAVQTEAPFARRKWNRMATKVFEGRLTEIAKSVDKLKKLSALLVEAGLFQAGFYWSSYKWRKRKRLQKDKHMSQKLEFRSADHKEPVQTQHAVNGEKHILADQTNSQDARTKHGHSGKKVKCRAPKTGHQHPQSVNCSQPANTLKKQELKSSHPDSEEITSTSCPRRKKPKRHFDKIEDELEYLVHRCKANEPNATEELNCFIQANPEIYRRYDDLSATVKAGWAKLITNGEDVETKSLVACCNEFKDKLNTSSEEPIIGLLADQVAIARIRNEYLQLKLISAEGTGNDILVGKILEECRKAQRLFSEAAMALRKYQKLVEALDP